MKNKSLLNFLIKATLFTLPFTGILTIYIHKDPFKVIRKYKVHKDIPMGLNENYVGWQNFLNHKDSIKYDSFLLGNSCSMGFPTSLWKNYLDDANPIRLYGSSESVYAISQKLNRLDELNVPIKNTLLLLDFWTLKKTNNTETHTKVLHPDVSKEGNIVFQMRFIAAFLNPKILLPFIDYSLFKTYRNYMRGIIYTTEIERNTLTNDIINPREYEISCKKDTYWIDHKDEFNINQNKGAYPPIINTRQQKILENIKLILTKHNTNFRIVINPQWDHRSLNAGDIAKLKSIFGKDKVFNYSGKNKYTCNKKYFYESTHYRPNLGKEILDEIYGAK